MTYPGSKENTDTPDVAKRLVGSREKRNMAAFTPQFKIKHNLERGEFARVGYANFSM